MHVHGTLAMQVKALHMHAFILAHRIRGWSSRPFGLRAEARRRIGVHELSCIKHVRATDKMHACSCIRQDACMFMNVSCITERLLRCGAQSA